MKKVHYYKTQDGKRLQIHATFLYILDEEGQSQAYVFRLDYYIKSNTTHYVCSGTTKGLKTRSQEPSHFYEIHNPIWPKSKSMLNMYSMPPHIYNAYHKAKLVAAKVKE